MTSAITMMILTGSAGAGRTAQGALIARAFDLGVRLPTFRKLRS